MFLFHDKKRGKPYWRYVLVKSQLLKKFQDDVASGDIDVADYGYVFYSGWGTDLPETTKKKLIISHHNIVRFLHWCVYSNSL